MEIKDKNKEEEAREGGRSEGRRKKTGILRTRTRGRKA